MPADALRRRFWSVAHRGADAADALPDEGRLGSFDRATGWLNSGPLTAESLRGRVVLVGFWTYTCVNWLRTLPYLRAWHAAYADAGLTIVGVHTPEFGFEHDVANVEARTRALGIEYPVALDADYGVWNDFANHYWPAVYLADASGRLRYHHFGESDYAMTEMAVQQLLMAAGAAEVDLGLAQPQAHGLEVAADWSTLRSPETYLGYGQSDGFASEDAAQYDRPRRYSVHPELPLNAWDLAGEWTQTRTAAVLHEAGGRLAYAFHARDVNLVMGPSVPGTAVPFRVLLDGQPVGDAHGTDVDEGGHGLLDRQDTYQLVRQRGRIADRLVEVEFEEDGVELYCVTFG
ncbi:redoxin domain-containing protein [Leifsonia sp. F6_8S_P_1B]|uniref:Redoxin domain-containing protein n=1 Tax=Leifsonia williamsii TaxID=3035919 RepID=A0ABT8KDJ3_9MICO|nr:redoxin domain-containing protein [Leifsonia williamsii]MDN4615519.1 redoxin domain-containing protein [Leifsonia williamsii]